MARGFASLPVEVRRLISAKGGKAAQAPDGRGHRFTPEEQRRGGARAWQLGKAHSFDGATGRVAGRKGGLSRHAKRRQAMGLVTL